MNDGSNEKFCGNFKEPLKNIYGNDGKFQESFMENQLMS